MFQTKIIQNDNNPIWNETFQFKFFSNPSTLKFQILDQGKNDDNIGFTNFDLNKLFNKTNNSKKHKPFSGFLQLKRAKKAKIKVKIFGKRFSPVLQNKIVQKQEAAINEQKNKLCNLKQQNKNLLN